MVQHALPRFIRECDAIVQRDMARRREIAEQIRQAADCGDCERVKELVKELEVAK